MKAGATPGAEKPMVKLRLSIEPASAAGSERRGTLVIQVGWATVSLLCCLSIRLARAAESMFSSTLAVQGQLLLFDRLLLWPLLQVCLSIEPACVAIYAQGRHVWAWDS